MYLRKLTTEYSWNAALNVLTHWCRVMQICISKLTSIASNNGLSPGRRQAITRTNAGILLIGPSGINFSDILIKIQIFLQKKMCLKMLPVECCSYIRQVPVNSEVTLPHAFQAAPPAPSHYILPLIIIWSANCQEPSPLSCWFRWIIPVPQSESQNDGSAFQCVHFSTVKIAILLMSYFYSTNFLKL